jgi:hypothetical protein
VSGLHLVIYGGIVIIVILYFPSGVSGAISRAWRRLSQRASPTASAEMKLM